MLDKKLNKLKKFVPKNSKVGKALALKDKLTGEDKKEEEEQKKKKGSGGTPSTMSIAKVVFGSGIAIGGAVIIGCIIMTAVTMFSTVTGTSVQIIDGSIIQYGEPTPGPEKDKKKSVGSGEYSGDELYIKLKMIVEAVEADNSLKKKVDKVKVPDSVPGDLRAYMPISSKRGGIYHILQVGYIFKELAMTDFSKNMKDKSGNKVDIDWRILFGSFIQENGCGKHMEQDFPSDDKGGWLSAYKVDKLDRDSKGNIIPSGALQMSTAYFGKGSYYVFVPSVEKDNGEEYGVVSLRKGDIESKIKYNKDNRMKANGATLDSFQFSDVCATAYGGLKWHDAYMPNSYWMKLVKKAGGKTEDSSKIFSMILFSWLHRGPAFYTENHKYDSSDLVKMVAEASLDGLLTEDELIKYMPKVGNAAGWEAYQSEFAKNNSIVSAIAKDDKCGFGINYMQLVQRRGAGYSSAGGNKVPVDIYSDVFYKLYLCIRSGQEIEALANAAFDELGLTLPTSGGGKMELKETPGEFQGFWSDKNGKTLSSDEMKAYCNKYSYLSNQIKYVGTKEDSTNFTGKYAVDSFKDKFGDNIGFIHYHQCGGTTYRANKLYCDSSGKTWGSYGYFCGGYSCAMAMSSLYHRYIHPVEIVCAKATYHDRTGKTMTNYTDGGTTSAFKYGGHHALFSEQVYKGKKMFKVDDSTALNKTKVDETLAAGGLVIGSFKPPIASGTHYVVIREKKGDKYYLGDSSANDAIRAAKNHNHEFTWADLDGCKNGGGNCTYISPAEGYKEYLNDYMTSQNASEGANGSGGAGGRYLGEEIVEYAKQFKGNPYKYGGTSLTNGCDCSGFVMSIYKKFGYDIPRSAAEQAKTFGDKNYKKVNATESDMKPGDLLFWYDSSRGKIGHVAMYIGNGKIIHAKSRSTGIVIDNYTYSSKPLKYVYRVIDDNAVSSKGRKQVNGGNYQYWQQGTSKVGTVNGIKYECPKVLSAGCFAYSLLKICKLNGSSVDGKTALDKAGRNGGIGSNGECLNYASTLSAFGLSGYSIDKVQFSKIDYFTSSGKKKLAKKIYDYQKKSQYVFVHIGNTARGQHHWVNMFSSDGKNIEVWDSAGRVPNGKWSSFINNRKSAQDRYASEFRVVKK